MKAYTILLNSLLALLVLMPGNAWQGKSNQAASSALALPFSQTVGADSVVVVIVRDDEVYVNKHKVAEGEIVAEVGRRLQDLPEEERTVFIKTAPEVSYGAFVRILDNILAHGYERIGLVRSKTQARPAARSAREANAGERSGLRVASGETMLVITVEAVRRGQTIIRIGANPVPLHNLASRIHALLIERAVRDVNIEAPATIQYQFIVPVIDEVKAGGAETIRFSMALTQMSERIQVNGGRLTPAAIYCWPT
ncbi:MAG TPA: biopolymer transporter ExbD [Pyrinomonadaceae bacterium]|nr:biopolymer transporter ExbD [Pyrinomonadaceae bacterium]